MKQSLGWNVECCSDGEELRGTFGSFFRVLRNVRTWKKLIKYLPISAHVKEQLCLTNNPSEVNVCSTSSFGERLKSSSSREVRQIFEERNKPGKNWHHRFPETVKLETLVSRANIGDSSFSRDEIRCIWEAAALVSRLRACYSWFMGFHVVLERLRWS